MLHGLISIAMAAARASLNADRKERSRRSGRAAKAPAEGPNPDFDFGPSLSPHLAGPNTRNRFASRRLLVLVLLALLPAAVLLVTLWMD
jgi:hypothetical protein